MSQENVEIVRAAIDAFNRGDVDAAFKDANPDFHYDQTRAVGIDRGVFNLEEFQACWRRSPIAGSPSQSAPTS